VSATGLSSILLQKKKISLYKKQDKQSKKREWSLNQATCTQSFCEYHVVKLCLLMRATRGWASVIEKDGNVLVAKEAIDLFDVVLNNEIE